MTQYPQAQLNLHRDFENQLLELESLLRKFKLWHEEPLLLESVTTPFGVGQISFPQWLQHVYLPGMRKLLVEQQRIPVGEIYPYAEEVLIQGPEAEALLACIRTLDNLSVKANAGE